jgi:hypothetical protein
MNKTKNVNYPEILKHFSLIIKLCFFFLASNGMYNLFVTKKIFIFDKKDYPGDWK